MDYITLAKGFALGLPCGFLLVSFLERIRDERARRNREPQASARNAAHSLARVVADDRPKQEASDPDAAEVNETVVFAARTVA